MALNDHETASPRYDRLTAHVRRQAGRFKRDQGETGSSWIRSVTVNDSKAIPVIEVRQRTNDRWCPSVGVQEARKLAKDMLRRSVKGTVTPRIDDWQSR